MALGEDFLGFNSILDPYNFSAIRHKTCQILPISIHIPDIL